MMRVHIWCSTEDGPRCAACDLPKTPATANMFCSGMPDVPLLANPHHPFPLAADVCPRCGITRQEAHTERQPFCPEQYRGRATPTDAAQRLVPHGWRALGKNQWRDPLTREVLRVAEACVVQFERNKAATTWSSAMRRIARIYTITAPADTPWVARQIGVVLRELAARPACASLLRYWCDEQAARQGEG